MSKILGERKENSVEGALKRWQPCKAQKMDRFEVHVPDSDRLLSEAMVATHLLPLRRSNPKLFKSFIDILLVADESQLREGVRCDTHHNAALCSGGRVDTRLKFDIYAIKHARQLTPALFAVYFLAELGAGRTTAAGSSIAGRCS